MLRVSKAGRTESGRKRLAERHTKKQGASDRETRVETETERETSKHRKRQRDTERETEG